MLKLTEILLRFRESLKVFFFIGKINPRSLCKPQKITKGYKRVTICYCLLRILGIWRGGWSRVLDAPEPGFFGGFWGLLRHGFELFLGDLGPGFWVIFMPFFGRILTHRSSGFLWRFYAVFWRFGTRVLAVFWDTRIQSLRQIRGRF